MSENVELQNLKNENDTLKQQMTQNSAGIHGLLAQCDAFKGELADARTISLQLRTNLIITQKSNNELADANKALQVKLDEANAKIKSYEDTKSAEVPPAPLKEVSKGK